MNRMSPFRSYSTETLHLFGTGPNANDGFMPSTPHRSSGSISQPRTPVSGIVPEFGSPRTPGAHSGRSLSIGSRSLGSGAHSGLAGGTSSGKTVKEYDESVRELKKENFNLKLRIYFLEERLGSIGQNRQHRGHEGARAGTATPGGADQSRENLSQTNMDLKIQVESLKYDVNEKSELLREAGLALEQLENKISTLTIEREEERQKLESKLRQIEDDFNENILLQNLFPGVVDQQQQQQQAKATPQATPRKRLVTSPDPRDDDEKLLKEVDEEMARAVPLPTPQQQPHQISSPAAKPSLMLPLTELSAIPMNTSARPNYLAVVEEKAAEQEVEELTKALRDTEKNLEEAQQEVQQRLKDMIAFESELVNRDIQITAMQDELSNAKIEFSQAASSHLEELNLVLKEHDAAAEKLEQAKVEIRDLKEKLAAKEADIKTLTEKLSEINSQVLELKQSLEEKDAILRNLQQNNNANEENSSFRPPIPPRRKCPDVDSPNFSIHTHKLSDFQESAIKPNRLQIVTQSLHIQPKAEDEATLATSSSQQQADDAEDSAAEVERLRRDMRKLKEYLKTSVQERKLLLKKIGTLNQRLADANRDGIRVNTGGGGAHETVHEPDSLEHTPHSTSFTQLHNARHLFLRIANLQQRLASACEDADGLRTHLDSLLDTLEPVSVKRGSPVSPDTLATIRRAVQESRQLSKSVSRAATPLVADTTSTTRDEFSESAVSSVASSWKNGLPDPSGVDLAGQQSYPSDPALIKHLSDEIERRNQDIEHKMTVLDVLEEQLEEKEGIIKEQAMLLEDYRQEIVRMREEEGIEENSERERAKVKRYRSFNIRRRTGSNGVLGLTQTPEKVGIFRSSQRGLSDGEDSWSEPDVNAARKRMGISSTVGAHSAYREKDSSETDLDKQKSFYLLEYTGQDFSDGSRAQLPTGSRTSEDYTKIIEELRSHRREIEKLQTDFVPPSEAGGNSTALKPDLKVNSGCNSTSPGSLECLLPSVSTFFLAMDNLSYQLDLTDSFDSGNGSDDGEDTELDASLPDKQEIHFNMCELCSAMVCQDFGHCLERSAQLILSSSHALRRLRRISSNLSSQLSKSNECVTKQNHVVSQLEATIKDFQRKAKVAEHVQTELEITRDDLNRKTRELQEIQVKINDNYKLVSELSNENLKLTGEKARAEELVEEIKIEQKRLKDELNSAKRVVESIKESGGGPQTHLLPNTPKRDSLTARHLKNKDRVDGASCSSPEPSSSTSERSPPSVMTSSLSRRCASSALESLPSLTSNKIYAHRGRKKTSVVSIGGEDGSDVSVVVGPRTSTGLRSTTVSGSRQLIRTDSEVPRAQSDMDDYQHRPYSSQPEVNPHYSAYSGQSDSPPGMSTGLHQTGATLGASDISSPDLGVDVSSDPFSSLERSSTLSEAMPTSGNSAGNSKKNESGTEVNAMVLENRQLRLDRDLLMQKLIRSKGALKETLDRLAQNNQHKQDQLSPMPPRRLLSSSSVLSSVGSGPSRSRVTQDLLEFSRTHQGSKRGEKHRPKKP